jgi:hypothetical protein
MNGGRIAYSQAELLFVAARRDLPRREIREAFVARFRRSDVSVAHIKALCTRHGWTTGREQFSADDDAILRERFPHMPTAQLAAELQRSPASVSRRAYTLGLNKCPKYLATAASGRLQRGAMIGASTQFRRGQVALNKGIKRPAGWSPGRMSTTQFKKAQSPRNWRPLGSTRIIKGYEFTKVGDATMVSWTVNWRQSHIVNWEAVNGPLPEGHALKSLDGNRRNTAASNWVAIPRALLPRLSGGRWHRLGYDQAPDEIKALILTTAKLAHVLKQRGRQKVAA